MKDFINVKNTPKVPPFLSWLFPYKIKKLPLKTKSTVGYYLLQNKISLTFINWIFQGMRGMGRADLLGKIMLEIICITAFLLILDGNILSRIIVAFLFGHTINWFANSHFWVFGRFLGITHTDIRRFPVYLRELRERVNNDLSITSIIVIGSMQRDEGFRVTSDVDIMFIRDKGSLNAVKAALVTIRERLIAFIRKFPLDLYLYDEIDTMKKHRADEIPVIMKDSKGLAMKWYKEDGRKPLEFGEV